MKVKTLSIIIPTFNEEDTVYPVLERISSVHLIAEVQKEIILINDASTDATEQRVRDFQRDYPHISVRYFKHPRNLGKGAAMQTGIGYAQGECLIVQDADLEYSPEEYNILLQPVIDGVADVVYGSRFMGGNAHRVLFFWHYVGNKFLTLLSNMFTNLNLTDMETGYKLFRVDMLKQLHLREKRFGFEPEITAKISRMKKVRIYEVGISYYGRTYAEGKKIAWHDGIWAIYCILKYNTWQKK